jgi:hypothetical protein
MAPIIRGNSLYSIVDGPSWTQAEANAVKLGGHLVSINGSDENLFIQNIAREYFDSKTYYMDGPQKYYLLNGQEQSSDIWIGLVESDGMEGTWTWTTGDPVTYMDTRGLYDDNGTQDYGAIRAIWNWTWDDQENVDINNILYGRNNVRYSNKMGIAEIPFVQRGDSAYVIVEGPSWEEAEANAVKLGGHLATITDAAENEWIMKNINWIIPGNPSYGAYNSDRLVAYWVGLSDKESEGNYVWSSGNAFSYSQPKWDKYPTPSEDYLTLVSNGEWNDID